MAFKIGSSGTLVIDNDQTINSLNGGGFNYRNYLHGNFDDSDAYGRGIDADSDIGFLNGAITSYDANGKATNGRLVGSGWKLYDTTANLSNSTYYQTYSLNDLIRFGDQGYDTSTDDIHYFCFYNPRFSAGYGNASWQFHVRVQNDQGITRDSTDYHYVRYQGLWTTSTEAYALDGDISIPLTDNLSMSSGGDEYHDFAFVECEVHDAKDSDKFTTFKWRASTGDGFQQGEGRCKHIEKHSKVIFYHGFDANDRVHVDDIVIAGTQVGTI